MNKPKLCKHELMRKIMEHGFALVDLGLYLDTHPDDKDSIATYSSLRDTYNSLTMEYVHCFGPITFCQVTSDNYWTWISEPWPWEGGCA